MTMTTILTSDTVREDGLCDVLAVQGKYANGAPGPAPTPRKGCTLRQVESLPPPPGTLHWDNSASTLVRVAPTISPIEQARGMAKAAFASLPPGKQALWEPVRAAVDAALVAGDAARAVSIIQTVPEIYDGMETDRAAFLALFAPPAQSLH